MSSQAAVLAKPFLPSEQLGQIEAALVSKPHVSLFLHFDTGLLASTTNPEHAVLHPTIRQHLLALSARQDFTLAIVSGLEMDQLRERVGLDHVIYAANYGLQIESEGQSFRNPDVESTRQELRCLHLQLKLALADIQEVQVEDVGLALTVHYGKAQEELKHWIARTAYDIIARSRAFTARTGAEVVAARPRIRSSESSAVNWVLHQMSPADTLPIYLGDDLTGEVANEAVPDGLTIKVGGLSSSAARLSLASASAVGRFLDWLDHAKPHAPISQPLQPGERPALV